MCSLTFVPTEDGYLVGMNRDELLTRPVALPPKVFERSGIEIVYPQEPSGGAWIACNGQGNLLALLNWSGSESHNLGEKRRTRGLAIPELIGLTDLSATDSHFHQIWSLGKFLRTRILEGEACQPVKTGLQARIPVEIIHRDLRSATSHFGVTDGSRILPVDTNREETWPGNVRAMKAANPAIAPSRGLSRYGFESAPALFFRERIRKTR